MPLTSPIHLSPAWPRIAALKAAQARQRGEVTNACRQWSGVTPVRHRACADLPTDQCREGKPHA